LLKRIQMFTIYSEFEKVVNRKNQCWCDIKTEL
jgi:hypothetical protein